MINTQDIDGIIGSEAVDQANDRIGKVGQVYLDSESDRPVWVSVKSGLFGTSETLVPLDGADWDSKALHLAFSKDRVKDAPRVEPDAELSPDEQDRLYDYYGLGQGGSSQGGSQDGTVAGGSATGDAGYGAQGTTAGSGTVQDGQAADYSGTVSDDEATRGTTAGDSTYSTGAVDDGSTITDTAAASGAAGAGYADADSLTDRDAGATSGTGAGYDSAATGSASTGAAAGSQGYDTSGPTTDDAMTRSEERLNVGAQKVQTGRARLRKYIVTEQQTVTVPVTHDEVRVEREPITDANVGAAKDGPTLSEEEHEVVLTEERPVVEKETVPVERVRLSTEEVTENRQVTEDVRHEEIETEGDGVNGAGTGTGGAARTDR